MSKAIHTEEIAGFKIEIFQTSRSKFTVIYGKQVKTNLTYDEAASEFGQCVLHALACEGKIIE